MHIFNSKVRTNFRIQHQQFGQPHSSVQQCIKVCWIYWIFHPVFNSIISEDRKNDDDFTTDFRIRSKQSHNQKKAPSKAEYTPDVMLLSLFPTQWSFALQIGP